MSDHQQSRPERGRSDRKRPSSSTQRNESGARGRPYDARRDKPSGPPEPGAIAQRRLEQGWQARRRRRVHGHRGLDTAGLERCLDRLEERPRACVVHAYVDGYTHEQIATRLGSPLGSVKSWIRRSLLALRECLSTC